MTWNKVAAARAHDAAIAEKLAEQGKTPEQVMFRCLDDAIALLDGTMVIYPDRYEHCFGFSLYRHLDHKPGLSQYEATAERTSRAGRLRARHERWRHL